MIPLCTVPVFFLFLFAAGASLGINCHRSPNLKIALPTGLNRTQSRNWRARATQQSTCISVCLKRRRACVDLRGRRAALRDTWQHLECSETTKCVLTGKAPSVKRTNDHICHTDRPATSQTPTCVRSFFLTQAPWSTLAAVGRGASGEKDMSLVKTTGKLYPAEVKRTGSGHELGEVGGVTAGCSFFS